MPCWSRATLNASPITPRTLLKTSSSGCRDPTFATTFTRKKRVTRTGPPRAPQESKGLPWGEPCGHVPCGTAALGCPVGRKLDSVARGNLRRFCCAEHRSAGVASLLTSHAGLLYAHHLSRF